jgi:hypothetical protein
MAQPATQDRETEHDRQDPPPAAAPAEPATPRALWPTFMRRTLAEEVLRRHSEPAGAK